MAKAKTTAAVADRDLSSSEWDEAEQSATATDTPLQPDVVQDAAPLRTEPDIPRGHVLMEDLATGTLFTIHASALENQPHLTDETKFSLKKKAS